MCFGVLRSAASAVGDSTLITWFVLGSAELRGKHKAEREVRS